jgi:hypothetical protein
VAAELAARFAVVAPTNWCWLEVVVNLKDPGSVVWYAVPMAALNDPAAVRNNRTEICCEPLICVTRPKASPQGLNRQ